MNAKFYDDLKLIMPKGCSFNYGYFSQPLDLQLIDFREQFLDFDYELYAINLYDAITTNLTITGKTGLDFSCGRASGAAYLAYTKRPHLMYAADRSLGNIEFAQLKFANLKHLKLETCSAEDIGYADNHFDFVLNVASFRLYQDPKKALSDFLRILKPSGDLIIADQFTQPQIDFLLDYIRQTPSVSLHQEYDLTKGTLESMILTQKEKKGLIGQFAFDEETRNVASEWGGLPESKVFSEFQTGQSYFNSYHLKKL